MFFILIISSVFDFVPKGLPGLQGERGDPGEKGEQVKTDRKKGLLKIQSQAELSGPAAWIH